MTDLERATKYREAAGYLKEHGWQQFSFGVDGGPRCVGGAMFSVVRNDIVNWLALSRAMMARLDVARLGTGWNDRPGQTKEQVIAFLEDFADEIELRYQIKHQPLTLLLESPMIQEAHA